MPQDTKYDRMRLLHVSVSLAHNFRGEGRREGPRYAENRDIIRRLKN